MNSSYLYWQMVRGRLLLVLRFSLKINKTDGRARVGGNEDVRELEGGGECGFGLNTIWRCDQALAENPWQMRKLKSDEWQCHQTPKWVHWDWL